MPMDKMQFCSCLVHLNGSQISFPDRPYLPAIYAARPRRLVLRTSRQVEKSTFLANSLVYELCTRAGIRILVATPRLEQAYFFVQSRLQPAIEQSPTIRRHLLGSPPKKFQVKNMRFKNGSELYVRAVFRSADAARGISADILLVDEYQDVASGALAVLQETLSHSSFGQIILVGTPKLLENQLDVVYAESTANEWTLDCPGCAAQVILDERCLGPSGVSCPKCQAQLDVRTGRWVARNPDSNWGEGYWINHLMAPWLNYHEILDRRRTYDLAQFKNEVLGLPTTLGEHVVTRSDLEACCGTAPAAQSLEDIPELMRDRLVMGIDWGGGRTSRTVVVIGYWRPDNKFVIAHLHWFRADEDPQRLIVEVAAICRSFRVCWIGADGRGNGLINNRLLLDNLGHRSAIYGLVYSDTNQQPTQDGTVFMWTVDRSSSIGLFYSMVRKRLVEFPRIEDCGWYLDELTCELAEYDNEQRRIRYVCPENRRDDGLHASVYGMLIMNRWLDCAQNGMFEEE
jgi:hypothetical protein